MREKISWKIEESTMVVSLKNKRNKKETTIVVCGNIHCKRNHPIIPCIISTVTQKML